MWAVSLRRLSLVRNFSLSRGTIVLLPATVDGLACGKRSKIDDPKTKWSETSLDHKQTLLK